jgi:Family of unknown function (DUF6279)
MCVASSVASRLRCWIIAAGVVVLLAGCSAVRLAYTQAPHLIYWWLDGYVSFDPEQGERARDALADWFRWHRATQLPEIADLLAKAQVQILHDITPRDACEWADEIRRRLEVGYEQGVPALAAMVHSLTPEQITRIDRRYRKADEEFRDDYLQNSGRERLDESNKRALSRAELLYGRLSDVQRALLAQGVADSPFDAERWLAERQFRQREIVDTLHDLQAQHADDARIAAALRLFAAHAAESPRPGYREYQRRLFAHNCALVARLHNSTSPEQRRRGAERLKGWEDDVRSLVTPRV